MRYLIGVVLLLTAVALGFLVGWQVGGPPNLDRWGDAIQSAADASGVDPALLRAMVAAESGGRPDALSEQGAHGLLQLLPSTAEEEARRLGISYENEATLYEPEINLRLGASYMARLLERYDGEEIFAVAAYNAGPTAVGRWRVRAPHRAPMGVILHEGYEETRRHVVKVLALRRHYAR